MNTKEHIVGILSTSDFNSLKVKETDQVEKYMTESVSYLHESDSLEKMITEIHNTNSLYFVVLDDTNDQTGFITIDNLLNYLLGK
jgi:predicted transcriptional regulator